jgi:hypothetical protein
VCKDVAVSVVVVVVFSSPSRVEVSYSTKWSESCVVAFIVVSSAAASGISGRGLYYLWFF